MNGSENRTEMIKSKNLKIPKNNNLEYTLMVTEIHNISKNDDKKQ